MKGSSSVTPLLCSGRLCIESPNSIEPMSGRKRVATEQSPHQSDDFDAGRSSVTIFLISISKTKKHAERLWVGDMSPGMCNRVVYFDRQFSKGPFFSNTREPPDGRSYDPFASAALLILRFGHVSK